MILRYRIGPSIVELHSALPPDDPENPYFHPFVDRTTAAPDLQLDLRIGDAPPRGEAPLQGELSDHWRLYSDGEGWRLEILEQIELQTRLVARIAPDWRRMTLHLIKPAYRLPGRQVRNWSLSGTMDPLVQWWMTCRLAQASRGLVLHAAAVSFDGLGGAFIGRSGAGKSTFAGWCHGQAGLTVLNDERIILWDGPDGWHVSGTPWSGDLAQASGAIAPLARLHLLHQAPVNEFRPLSPRAALFRLLEEASLPVWHPEWSANAVTTAARMLQQIPCGELHNRKEPAVVQYVRQSIRQAREVAVP